MSSSVRAAERGSQHWLQRAVEQREPALESPLRLALGRPDARIDWRSPLPPEYREYRDGAVMRTLGCELARRPLAEFWPMRGPVWDGLAVVDDQFVLIEAKAHIPELLSGGSKAGESSLPMIRRSLDRARAELAPRSKADWATSPFFQYANRLAFLQFLREDNELPAHLVFVYFTNDVTMAGPESAEEWKGA